MSDTDTPTRDLMADLLFLQRLCLENGYRAAKPLPARPGFYACICDFIYTTAILYGELGDAFGYRDRWCFHDLRTAVAAYAAWDGEGEPQGWHRHPDSGRRRPDGDAAREYLNP